MRKGMTAVRTMVLGVLWLLAMAAAFAADPGQAIEQTKGLDPDFAANYRVEMIGQRLALAAGIPDIRYAIFNDKELNAFALPDGRIYLTSLMAHAVSDDELAFVIGHEITHIKEGHAKHQSERATGGAILGAIIAAVLGGGNSEIRMGADILGGLTLGHYSRKDERRADEYGLQLMARAGYDPTQAPLAMQRLIDKYGSGDAKVPILGWFATHPDTRSRRERLQEGADALVKHPPEVIAPPLGVDFTLDPAATHAAAWAHNYFSIAMTSESGGRAVVVPPMHPMPVPAPAAPPADETRVAAPALAMQAANGASTEGEKKDEPLPPVIVKPVTAPIAYRVTLNLRQAPAGRAATLDDGQGTAVEATLQWTDAAAGFTGALAATAQSRKPVPWRAQDQVVAPDALHLLSDGKNDNIEGTLEAAAVRRIARAFAEILKAGGPVDHSAPVTLKVTDGSPRAGDYIAVVRGDKFVAEVAVDQVNGKNVSGTVLWGTHLWQKKDRFITMAN